MAAGHISIGNLISEAVATIRQPRDTARRMLGLNLPPALLWQMLCVVVAISVVLGQGTLMITAGGVPFQSILLTNPVLLAALQITLLYVTVFAAYRIGRAMGGVGTFHQSLTLFVWLQFVMVCLQVLQTILMFVMPVLADLVGIAGLFLFLWIMTCFVAELHGFKSLWQVFLMIMVSAFAIAFGLSLLLAIFGLTPTGV
ncbi:Yip1 family protein [Qingshengfaniella alkalisoli]|uniref:YIP1 family protein n=1 Tax=Qingshengfaniella alkalisoli TaxID=2599296 RepID=A0A5B8J4L7_9RHOB|nr:Yip1 family protein [Qingshengfaniella alkalisoli]QDY69220.1 YIP1 family protein [Qingshengfaniella alkalisoli]